MIPLKYLIPPSLALTLSACCCGEPSESLRVELNPWLSPCMSWYPTSCMTGKDGNGNPVAYHEGEIEGFRFEWGYRQTLDVEAHPVANPPADGSSIRYTLSRAVAKTAEPDWRFRTWGLDTTLWEMTGDTLKVEGYPWPIKMAAAADRAFFLGQGDSSRISIRVRPGTGAVLEGDSARAEPVR